MAQVPVQIAVLGSLEVRRGTVQVAVPGTRPRTALAALLVHTPYPVSVDALLAAIWGEHLPARPRGALHTVISRLRAVLGGSVVVAEPAGYRLALAPRAVDADRFDTLCRQAGDLPATRAGDVLDSALALWRGPAYAEFADQDFAVAEATRLEDLRAHAVQQRAEIALALGETDVAVSALRGLVAEQPLQERANGLLMSALYRSGRTPEALDVFSQLRHRLAAELGLEPAPALRDLQVRILGHTVPRSPAPRPPDLMPPGWQPAPQTFIGRADETGTLRRVVAAHRLVCVTGPGGVGKSRLIAETLPGLTRQLARPAAVVELEDATPEALDQQVVAALGLGASAHPRADLLEYLAASSLLLVLDGCEQVLDEVRSLAGQVLRQAPRVHLVATSRQRLDLSAEQVLPLTPLAVPGRHAGTGQAAMAPAMRLFIQRLRSLKPTIALTAPVVAGAGTLCRRLDGMPLSLELAATQAATLGIEAVLGAMGTGLHLTDTRLGSLHDVVERSYLLLSESDRILLHHLSAFTGTFGVDDVARLVPSGPVPAGLARLVQASLVDAVGPAPPARFRLLGIVRAFAGEHAGQDAAEAYWRWAKGSSAQWSREATGPGSPEALNRLHLARADLTAAAASALAAGHLQIAADTIGPLGLCVHWIPGAALDEVSLQVGEHPELEGLPGEPLARASAALAAVERGELDRGRRLARRAQQAATHPAEHYLALVPLSVAAVYAGARDAARRHWHQILDIDGLDGCYRVDAHAALALILAASGSLERAQTHAARARRAAERSGAAGRVAFALYATGEVLQDRQPHAATDVLTEAARLADQVHAEQVSAVSRVALLSVLTRTGQVDAAIELSLTLLELQQRRGHWPQLWTTMRILAEAFAAAGRGEPAELVLAAADAAASAPGLAGGDVERYRGLRAGLRQSLGADRAARIDAVARVLPRTEILDRARDTAQQLNAAGSV